MLHAYKRCDTIKTLRKQVRSGVEWEKFKANTKGLRERLADIIGVEEVKVNKLSAVYHAIKADTIHGKKKHDISEEDKAALIEAKDTLVYFLVTLILVTH